MSNKAEQDRARACRANLSTLVPSMPSKAEQAKRAQPAMPSINITYYIVHAHFTCVGLYQDISINLIHGYDLYTNLKDIFYWIFYFQQLFPYYLKRKQ